MRRIIDRLQVEGIGRRGGLKTGFRYFYLDNRRPVRDPAALKRIRHLAVPPAWRSVAINRSDTHRVQAVGRDEDDRWQYLYHDEYRAKMDRKKFEEMKEFAGRLPRLRRTVATHLRQEGLTRERVPAAMVRILDTGMTRVGSEEYAREHKHYGLSTMRHRHVAVRKGVVYFDYTGKSGVKRKFDVQDRVVARLVRELLALDGGRVFRYRGDDGDLVNASGAVVNDYFKEIVGRTYSVKDFRTWMATVMCACALGEAGPKETKREQNQAIKAAIQLTAGILGNTPAICKASYISPRVLDLYRKGVTVALDDVPEPEAIVRRCRGLHPAERATLRLLRAHG